MSVRDLEHHPRLSRVIALPSEALEPLEDRPHEMLGVGSRARSPSLASAYAVARAAKISVAVASDARGRRPPGELVVTRIRPAYALCSASWSWPFPWPQAGRARQGEQAGRAGRAGKHETAVEQGYSTTTKASKQQRASSSFPTVASRSLDDVGGCASHSDLARERARIHELVEQSLEDDVVGAGAGAGTLG